jgi:hypothetical protein
MTINRRIVKDISRIFCGEYRYYSPHPVKPRFTSELYIVAWKAACLADQDDQRG